MNTKLILVRHGETEKNVSGKLHSSSDPEVLNKKGRNQMETTAKYLLSFKSWIIYGSKEKRANESAEIIAKVCKVPMKLIDGMQERDWGDFSGKSWDEIKKVLDPMSLEERYTYIPPKGESWKEFEERLIKTVNHILRENENKTVVVVTHGGAIRALMPYLLGVPKEESFKYDPDNASLTIFDYSKGKFKNKKINDTSHLK